MINIILIDDEVDWLDIVKTMLHSTLNRELNVLTFLSTSAAFDHIMKSEEKIDCIISDYLIPDDITGLDLYYKLIENKKEKNFILISNSKIPPDRIKELVQKKIVYLPKSFLVVKNFVKKHLEDILEIND